MGQVYQSKKDQGGHTWGRGGPGQSDEGRNGKQAQGLTKNTKIERTSKTNKKIF